MKSNTDALHVIISDLHTGSNNALFLDRAWHGINTSHLPRSNQEKIRAQWNVFKKSVGVARKGKKVKLVVNGDAIDGDHHHSGDVCTLNMTEQSDIHIELMTEFQKEIDWDKGDELYYLKGTLVHTIEYENYIARELNAVPNGDFYSWDYLSLNTNGAYSLFVHHGGGVSAGANEGNAQKNTLRNMQIEAMKDGTRPPDIVYSGHVHTPTYQTHTYRANGFDYRTMHYVITPSWQMKTRYAWMKAPINKNRIGGVIHEIKADGTITIPKFIVMTTE